MANNIVLCADSTCDLSPELKEKYHVHTFPLHVLLEDVTYADGVDLTPMISTPPIAPVRCFPKLRR